MRTNAGAVFVCLTLAALPLGAQGTAGHIRGTVRDSAGVWLAGVEVYVPGTSLRVTTDAEGRFVLAGVAPGQYALVARKLGFAAETLAASVRSGDTASVAFRLGPQPMELSAVDVRAPNGIPSRLDGFERRRSARNGGQFITRETIERRGSSRTTDYLRGIPGIQMVDSMGVTIGISSRGAKVNLTSRNKPVEACVVRVGVDGIIKDPLFGINLIPPTDIHGIEVYAGAATMPPEFNSTAGRNAQCGLIMIWTRSR